MYNHNTVHIFQMLLCTIVHVRAESDDLASFSDSLYRDVNSDNGINLRDSLKELDINKHFLYGNISLYFDLRLVNYNHL